MKKKSDNFILNIIIVLLLSVSFVLIILGIEYGEYLFIQERLPEGMDFWDWFWIRFLIRR